MTLELLVAKLRDDFVARRRVIQGGGDNTSAFRTCEQPASGSWPASSVPLNEAEHLPTTAAVWHDHDVGSCRFPDLVTTSPMSFIQRQLTTFLPGRWATPIVGSVHTTMNRLFSQAPRRGWSGLHVGCHGKYPAPIPSARSTCSRRVVSRVGSARRAFSTRVA